jgi:nicotinamidase-related amidase
MKNKTALLLVDMQVGLVEQQYWSYWGGNRNNPALESNIQQILSNWRSAQQPVIHVKHNSRNPKSMLHISHPGNAICPQFAPIEKEVLFEKDVNSAFIGTGLQEYLQQHGIKDLVVVGMTTNHCVSTSVRMASNLDFNVTLIFDGSATFDGEFRGQKISSETVHLVNMASLNGEFAKVVDTSDVLSLIE